MAQPARDYLAIATKYAKDIIAGKIPAPYYLKVQCEMFIADLKSDKGKSKYRYTMSAVHANHVCKFFEFALKHVKTTEWFGKPFTLFPFQVFFLINVFGWRMSGDLATRRYQSATLFIPRKNGKTSLVSGMLVYELFCGDMGAEILVAATILQQAEIAYDISKAMMRRMPNYFRKRVQLNKWKAEVISRNSKFTPLSNNPETKDGLNPSMISFDEAAAIADHKVFTVLKSGTMARRNSLQIYTTTAQPSQTSYFYEYLTGLRDNYDAYKDNVDKKDGVSDRPILDRRFAMLFYLESHEDWTDKTLWYKANPCLGTSLLLDSFEGNFEDAQNMPSERVEFKTKSLNIWERVTESWIDMEEYADCVVPDAKMMRAGDLYLTVDMAISRDLACVGMMYVRKGKWYYDYQCFYPRKSLSRLSSTTRSIFDMAVASKKILLTDKDRIDQEVVIDFIVRKSKDRKTKLRGIGFDSAHSANVQNRLLDFGLDSIDIQQSAMAMSAPTDELDRLIGHRIIKIIDCSFLKWQAGNCVLKEYANKNTKVMKPDNRPEQKIDAIVCMIMGVSMVSAPPPKTKMDVAVFTDATTKSNPKKARRNNA